MGTSFGIDLAWSKDMRSGCVALDQWGRVISEELLLSDSEIIDWITRLAADRCTVAIDAPLAVSNDTGQRPCENAVAKAYGSRHASPHSSNRTRLIEQYGRIRGEDIVGLLHGLGFGHPTSLSDRQYLEVYPHPAIVEMFELPSIIKYKSKKYGAAVRRSELGRLNELIHLLKDAEPPLLSEKLAISDTAGGSLLKEAEDLLDARVCAWIAAAWNQFGTERVRIFGMPDLDHIAIPNGPATPPQ